MGLKEVADDASASSKSTWSSSSPKGSSSSNNSTGNNFPKYRRRAPQAVIKTNEDGDLESQFYPHTPELAFKKDWYTAPWEPADALPGNWEKIWWDEQSLKHSAHIVESELGEDFMELMKEDAGTAVRMLNRAANTYNTEKGPRSNTIRDCAVCGTELNLLEGDSREINNRVVCSSHNVEELHDAGLLD